MLISLMLVGITRAQEAGYVVTLKGDTVRGDIELVTYGPYKRSALYKLKNKKFKKLKFRCDTISYMKLEDKEFYLKAIIPNKKKSDNDLMSIVKEGCGSIIYKRTYKQTTVNSNGTGSTSYPNVYYLYDGDKFVDILKRKNYEELLSKYFACDEKWIKRIKHDKKYKFHNLFNEEKTK